MEHDLKGLMEERDSSNPLFAMSEVCLHCLHAFIHSHLPSSLPPSLPPSLPSFLYACMHPFFHASSHPSIQASIHSVIDSFVHSFIRSFIHSFNMRLPLGSDLHSPEWLYDVLLTPALQCACLPSCLLQSTCTLCVLALCLCQLDRVIMSCSCLQCMDSVYSVVNDVQCIHHCMPI